MRNLALLISLLLILVFTTILQAKIINVPADSSTIQGGINGATFGDTVMVAPGTYYEYDIDYHRKGILVTSHFPEDSAWVASVVVDADSLGRVFHFHTFEDSNSVLKGLTITGGAVGSGGGAGILCDDSSPKIEYCLITRNVALRGGGGIRCLYRSPKIRNCMISDNIVLDGTGGGIECIWSFPSITNCTINGNWVIDGVGGGMYLYESSPTVENCTISQDSALTGGGIRIHGSTPNFVNCTITDNVATLGSGGGVECYFSSSHPTFDRCSIINNRANHKGGGLYLNTTNSTVINCIIANNWAPSGGGIRFVACTITMANCTFVGNSAHYGGAINSKDSNGEIINCTFSTNFAYNYGGAVFLEESFPITVNSIFWDDVPNELYIENGDVPIITYSNIAGGWEGEGNIESDPLFRNPSLEDFYLMAIECGDSVDSPCIDVGNPAIIDSVLDCAWGLGTELSDMGAYGGGKTLVGIVDQTKPNHIPRQFALNQNYPNPFNPTTTISFDIPGEPGDKQHSTLIVYDLRGRHVKTLIDEEREPGTHQVVWDGKNEQGQHVSSGIYLYTLKNGDQRYTRKMVMLE